MPEPSPMMAQYQGVKDRYPGHLVLFRVGDFFETFGEDAKILSRDAEVVLTGRQMDGEGHRIPLAGVPAHAVEGYLARLVRKGHRVVVCDQVEDARAAKGLVRREVVRVVTPGTVLEENLLPRASNNFLCAFASAPSPPAASSGPSEFWCACLVDVSTGETILRSRPRGEARLLVEDVAAFLPSEVVLPSGLEEEGQPVASMFAAICPTARCVPSLPALAREELPAGWREAAGSSRLVAETLGSAAAYARATEPRVLPLLAPPRWHRVGERLELDLKTLRHLEISEPMNPGPLAAPTLLDVVNLAVTAPGRRTVEAWLRSPLADVRTIRERLEAVASLVDDGGLLISLGSELKAVGDISRLAARLVARRGGPRELLALARSLQALPEVRRLLLASPASKGPGLARVLSALDPREPFARRLEQAVRPDAPAQAREGGVLRSEAFPELASLREAQERARSALRELEKREAGATGIRTLKIGYTQVFGYYFEVTRPHASKVPHDRWRRKQTLAGSERFTSDELTRLEAEALHAEQASLEAEARAYETLLGEVGAEAGPLQATSAALGELDALACFARIAKERNWVRPTVTPGTALKIRQGRHPILEHTLGPRFVPNDTELDASGSTSPRLLLLTGPNMAGKSTYMRQVALIVVLAQAGSFVPARFAEVGVVRSLHTRMGFTDDIGRGKSSFMVEMSEVAEILGKSDADSLVLLDEVGRGTSTSDGLALAWGVVKYLHDQVRARALVATHYHTLSEFVEGLPTARNAHLAVREEKGEITFLRTLLPGGTDKSYGVHVAELAGVPAEVVKEARRVLRAADAPLGGLASKAVAGSRGGRGERSGPPSVRYTQALLLEDPEADRGRELLRELSTLQVDHMTPIQALQKLHELQRHAAGRPAPAPEAPAASESEPPPPG